MAVMGNLWLRRLRALAMLCGIVAAVIGGLVARPREAAAESKFPVPPITGHVTDTAFKLSTDERLSLDKKLDDYRKCSQHEIAVLLTDSLHGVTVDDAAYVTFNTWKVGRAKEDDGVLLVIAPNERQIRIETGKGVGGSLTDIETAHIIRDRIKPNLKEDRFFQAVDEATTAIGTALGGCAIAPAATASSPISNGTATTPKWKPPPSSSPPPSSAAAKERQQSVGQVIVLSTIVGPSRR